MTQEIVEKEELEKSPDWVRSIGKKWYGVHYRERDGTRHAICMPWSDTCHVHEDKVNAHDRPVTHLVKDAPELVLLAGIGVAFGPKAAKKVWKYLP